MPPTSPQPSYTKKPVRRLRLPKIGPPKTKGFFEEYFYACLGVCLVATAILGWAAGMGGYDALVLAAWLTGFGWFARQMRDYFREKSKAENEKAASAAKQGAEPPKGPLPLPPGMKPMIGPQWPVKAGPFPTRPGLRSAPSVPPTLIEKQAGQTSPATQAGPANSNSNAKKSGFIYQRPTLPDRKPKLPHNWLGQNAKKPKR
jgi:hypothetical protein